MGVLSGIANIKMNAWVAPVPCRAEAPRWTPLKTRGVFMTIDDMLRAVAARRSDDETIEASLARRSTFPAVLKHRAG